MSQPPLLQDPEFKALAGNIINGKNLGPGGILLWLVTLLVGVGGAIFCLRFFPDGDYPRIVLIAPGLVLAALVFFIGTTILFKMRSGK